MATDPVALGALIKTLREERGYSIGKAAKRAGITAAYWHAIENASPSGTTGKPAKASVPVLRAIADAIGGDRSELLDFAGHHEDAAFDRTTERRTAAVAPSVLDRLSERQRQMIEALLDELIGTDDELEQPPAAPAVNGNLRTPDSVEHRLAGIEDAIQELATEVRRNRRGKPTTRAAGS